MKEWIIVYLTGTKFQIALDISDAKAEKTIEEFLLVHEYGIDNPRAIPQDDKWMLEAAKRTAREAFTLSPPAHRWGFSHTDCHAARTPGRSGYIIHLHGSEVGIPAVKEIIISKDIKDIAHFMINSQYWETDLVEDIEQQYKKQVQMQKVIGKETYKTVTEL